MEGEALAARFRRRNSRCPVATVPKWTTAIVAGRRIEMPFDRFMPHAFSLTSVQRNAPALSGVYGLSNAREWLLVGETDNIRAALLGHLQETHTPLLEREPTGFSFELCVSHNRVARQERLTQEYQPVFEQRSH